MRIQIQQLRFPNTQQQFQILKKKKKNLKNKYTSREDKDLEKIIDLGVE